MFKNTMVCIHFEKRLLRLEEKYKKTTRKRHINFKNDLHLSYCFQFTVFILVTVQLVGMGNIST